jgi:hypothetical protein
MAEAAIPCSSGCTVQMGSIRDRRLPVKSRTERFLRPRQDTPSQSFAARLSFFTSVCCRSARIRRSHDLINRERAVQSMRDARWVGPSRSAFRSRSQTTFKLLRSRAVVVSVEGKVRGRLAQVRIRETNESEPIEDASLKTQMSSKPGAWGAPGISLLGA